MRKLLLLILLLILFLSLIASTVFDFYAIPESFHKNLIILIITMLIVVPYYFTIGRNRLRRVSKMTWEQKVNLPWNYFLKSWWGRRDGGRKS